MISKTVLERKLLKENSSQVYRTNSYNNNLPELQKHKFEDFPLRVGGFSKRKPQNRAMFVKFKLESLYP